MNIAEFVGSHCALTTPSASNSPAHSVSWHEVTRLCRRICVLREMARDAEAEQLRHGPLLELIAAIRTTAANSLSVDQHLEQIFAAEADRVADAAVLAELLLPILESRFASPSEPRKDPAPFHRGASAAPFAADTGPVAATPRPAPDDIAAFIDEMIAHEREAPRPLRRAS